MVLGMFIVLCIITIILFCIADVNNDDNCAMLFCMFFIFTAIVFVFGCFSGFINYPATHGVHQGIVTAVDLEGIYFRRYEVYIKSGGYSNQSDETKYLLYEYEDEIYATLIEAMGKEVKITYGHDGGYIPWNSCGTYHIKSVELVEGE